MSKPLSSQRGSKSLPGGCLALFFLLFLVAGLAATWWLLVVPLRSVIAAQSWGEASCRIVESRVEENRDSDGSTYRVFIRYTYALDAGFFESTRYDFQDFWSSGYEGKARVVARYPPGARVPCWVDPLDPSRAVLDRGFGWRYAIGLFPLPFLAVGVGGLVWMARQGVKRRRGGSAWALWAGSRRGRAARADRSDRATRADRGGGRSPFGVELPADLVSGRELTTLHPFLKFLGIVLVTLFWNGITSVFLWKVVEGWRSGSPDGCLTLFIIPFVLVGLLMIAGMGSQFLVLFNPRPRLTLTPGTIAPGETAYLHWRISGRARRIRRLRLELQGAERASYRQGTDTKTVEEVFATILLAEADQPFAIAEGSASFSVPAGTMPSFEAPHNKIAWTVKAHLDIPGWPDTQETYDVIVRPGRR